MAKKASRKTGTGARASGTRATAAAAPAPPRSARTQNAAPGVPLPIHVKPIERVGRPDIDQFEAVMEREDRQRGFFVAFGYTEEAERECAGFHCHTGRVIKLVTVQEILDKQHVQKT